MRRLFGRKINPVLEENIEELFRYHYELALDLIIALSNQKEDGLIKESSSKDYEDICFVEDAKKVLYFGLTESAVNHALIWLEEDSQRRCWCVVPSFDDIIGFFSRSLRETLWNHTRFQWIWGSNTSLLTQRFAFWLNQHPLKKIAVYRSPLLQQQDEEIVFALMQDFYKKRAQQNVLEKEYLGPNSCIVIDNFIHNLFKPKVMGYMDKMKDICLGVPALIVGAGPSLHKQVEELKNSYGQALIFAGGSSVLHLDGWGISPHFMAGLDPSFNECGRYFYHHHHEVPFCFKPRFQYRALDYIHNRLLYLGSASGYPFVQYLEKKMGVESKECSGGIFTTNVCIEMARILGCNPIILVGMDLSLSSSQVKKEGQTCEGVNSLGEKVMTHWQWMASVDWFVEYQKKYPEVTFINTSQEGLTIPNVAVMTLENALKTKKNRTYDLSNFAHTAYENSCYETLPSHFSETSDAWMKQMKEALVIIESYLENRLSFYLEQLHQTPVYHYFLKPFSHAYRFFKDESDSQDNEYLFFKQKLEDFITHMQTL